jgi:hypothetical protein
MCVFSTLNMICQPTANIASQGALRQAALTGKAASGDTRYVAACPGSRDVIMWKDPVTEAWNDGVLF